MVISLEHRLHTIFSLEHVAQNKRSTTKESQDSSKKNSDATKRLVSAAKSNVATMPILTSTNLVAKV